jgi:hypothetical protein
MAKILNFRSAEFRAGEGTSRREGDSAEVILFPGIRYERWSETGLGAPTAAAATQDACRTSRDVLELAE